MKTKPNDNPQFYISALKRDNAELTKQNLPYGFKVNAYRDIPEDDPGYESSYTGNPIEQFGTRADKFTPEVFKKFVENASNNGASLLGGCCEIKPRHIKQLKNIF